MAVYFGTYPEPVLVGGCTKSVKDASNNESSPTYPYAALSAAPYAAPAPYAGSACVLDPDAGVWLNVGTEAPMRAVHGSLDLMNKVVRVACACAVISRDPAIACRASLNRMLHAPLRARGHVDVRRRAKKHATDWTVLQAHIESPDYSACCYALRVHLTAGAVDLTIHSANGANHVGPTIFAPISMRVYDPRRAELLEVGVTTMITTGSLIDLAIAVGVADVHPWMSRFRVVRHTLACASSIDLDSDVKVDVISLSRDKIASSSACQTCRACRAYKGRGNRAAAAAAAAEADADAAA